MKRVILCVLALLLCCGCAQTQEDPFRVDTVVLIPVDPTAPPTEEPTEVSVETTTEMPTELSTEPEETTAPKKTTSYKGTSSGGNSSSSSKNPVSTTEKPQESKPPVAEQTPALPPVVSPEQPYNPATYTMGELEYAILQELNRYRLENELGTLIINERLSGIAHLRAQEASVLWSHTRPDGRGYTSVLTEYGFENEVTAELMIQGFAEADAAYYVAKWMGYKTSHGDICNGAFTTAGIGVYSSEGITFVVCLLIG